jgi:DNA-binding winged helix-turn-helix (wHTH) protein/tetratricopeptide (TPR) repeat protein
MIYRFGTFQADSASGELQKKGVRVKLQEQPFQLLILLLETPGEIVTRESVRNRLWSADTFVDFDASLSVAIRKLRDALGDDADNPRFVETIPKRGYRFISPVQTIGDNPTLSQPPPSPVQSSQPSQSSSAAGKVSPQPASHSKLPLIASVAVALAALTFLAVRYVKPRPKSGAPTESVAALSPTTSVRRSVAVLGFRNLPKRKEDDWLSEAFTEMLGTELAADGTLRLISDEDLARAKRELSLQQDETLSRQTLERLHHNPGADLVVAGAYTALPGKGHDRIRLDVRLQDTSTGETIAESAVTGNKDDLFEIAAHAGSDLRKNLGVKAISAQDAGAVRASLPANEDAIRYYSEGRAKFAVYDFTGSRVLFANAIKADPQFPLSHAGLADALWHLGYASKSSEESKRAVELSANLPEEERLAVQGSYQAGISNWSEASKTYTKLFQLHPDNLEYGLHLAGAQFHVKPADALTTLKVLRRLPSPLGDDPRIDMLEASAQVSQDLNAADAAARRALAKGTAQGSPLMVARAYGILCQLDPSRNVPMADSLSDCEQAIRAYEVAGDLNNVARTRNDLAGAYFRAGDMPRAAAIWKTAQAEFRKLDDPLGLAASSNNLGDVLLEQGDLRAAKQNLEESIPQYVAVGDKSGIALVLNDLGELETRRGNLAAAQAYIERGQSIAAEVGDKSVMAYLAQQMGEVYRERGEYDKARESYGRAKSLRIELGEAQSLGESNLALAELSLDEGNAASAEQSVRDINPAFIEHKEPDDQLAAETLIIQTLLAQGKATDALAQVENTKPLAARSDNLLQRLRFELASALARSAANHPEARHQLQQLVATARSKEFIPLEFETRIEIAKLKQKARDNSSTADLNAVRILAAERNLNRIVKLCDAAPHSTRQNWL